MKLKKIVVPRYVFRDARGEVVFQDVTLLFPLDSVVTPESFNQEADDYYIASTEIDRMWNDLNDLKREHEKNCIEAEEKYCREEYDKYYRQAYAEHDSLVEEAIQPIIDTGEKP